MKQLATALLVLAAMALPARADDPSFDCGKAGTAVEKLICDENHGELALRDGAMGRIVQALKDAGGHGAVLADQPAWLAERDSCGPDADCLARRYDERLAILAHEAGDAAGVTGNYHYKRNDTDAGDAVIIRESDGTLTGLIDSVTGKEAKTCDVSFEGGNPIGDAYVWDDPGPPEGSEDFCRILFRPENGKLRIDSDTCQAYCGEGASFDGTYARVK
jgi:uncharacterized protein